MSAGKMGNVGDDAADASGALSDKARQKERKRKRCFMERFREKAVHPRQHGEVAAREENTIGLIALRSEMLSLG
jgi:hypothetical protein